MKRLPSPDENKLDSPQYLVHSTNQSSVDDLIPLSNILPGQRAKIIRVGGTGLVRRRYMEMGFVRGETIRVDRIAPLGDPVEYHVKGYQLSLRRRDAEQILVKIIDSSDSSE